MKLNQPRRLRPRYVLPIAFALLAIVAIWAGWEASVVQQRTAFLKALGERGGSYAYENPFAEPDERPPDFPLPWLRRMMGDRTPLQISTTTQADEARANELFPECPNIGFFDPAAPVR